MWLPVLGSNLFCIIFGLYYIPTLQSHGIRWWRGKALSRRNHFSRRNSRVRSNISRKKILPKTMEADGAETLPLLRVDRRSRKPLAGEERGQLALSHKGRIDSRSLAELLACQSCRKLCNQPIIQCSTGHPICKACRPGVHSCPGCSQHWLGPGRSPLLDRVLSLVHSPCQYESRGCQGLLELDKKREHEALCLFRPLPCQFRENGCDKEFSAKDVVWHHKMCKFAAWPHNNILPDMPRIIIGSAEQAAGNQRS